MFARARTARLLFVSCLIGISAAVASDLQKTDASQWNGNQVYAVLHNSPWTKTVKVTYSNKRSSSALNDQSSPNPATAPPPPPPAMGGVGRRGGMGGSRTYTAQSGQRSATSAPKLEPEEVTVQWQSALPVRLAAARMAAENLNGAPENPPGTYVIAVIGLPLADFGGRAATADFDQNNGQQDNAALAEHLKNGASLITPGHEPLKPTKVALDQGVDGRTVFYFPKSYPITPKDKTVEFKLSSGRAEIRKKFDLKEMEYKGQLDL